MHSQNNGITVAIILFFFVLARVVSSSTGTTTMLRSRTHLVGNNNNYPVGDEKNKNKNICRVTVIGSDGPGFEKDNFICEIVTLENVVGDSFLQLHLPEEALIVNRELLFNHSWFIEYSDNDEKIQYDDTDGSVFGNLYFDQVQEIVNVPQSQVKYIQDQTHHQRQRDRERRRKLELSSSSPQDEVVAGESSSSSMLGAKTLVVVLVDVDLDDDAVNDRVFGETHSLASQVAGCSHSQTTIVPHPTHPIVRVQLALKDPSLYSYLRLYDEATWSIKYQLGLSWFDSLLLGSDYYLFIVPDTIEREPTEVAWAPLHGLHLGIIESWSDSVQTVMHELGHNFGIAHAYEAGREYGDTTTVMGFARRASNLCFNGQNFWHMDWYKDRRWELLPSKQQREEESTSVSQTQFVQLAFYGDYDRTNSNQPVVVKIGDNIFLTFNRKKGINQDTGEYDDMLLIVREDWSSSHDGLPISNLIQALPPSEANDGNNSNNNNNHNSRFIVDNFFNDDEEGNNNSLLIQVCGCTILDDDDEERDTTPDFLTVAIGRYNGDENYNVCNESDDETFSSGNNNDEESTLAKWFQMGWRVEALP